MPQYHYDHTRFAVSSEAEARSIILTGDTDKRWELETLSIRQIISHHRDKIEDRVCMDFGCGIGRISKILSYYDPKEIWGIDQSKQMQNLYFDAGFDHVRFPKALDGDIYFNTFDFAIAVWVIQHTESPSLELTRIFNALKPGGYFFIINEYHRSIPVEGGMWADDGIDVESICTQLFQRKQMFPFETGYWALYRKAK